MKNGILLSLFYLLNLKLEDLYVKEILLNFLDILLFIRKSFSMIIPPKKSEAFVDSANGYALETVLGILIGNFNHL
jgi:hypothetical protein